jgi:hypothetical protein
MVQGARGRATLLHLRKGTGASLPLTTVLRGRSTSAETTADECDGFTNKWTVKFASDVTKRLNWRFYCLAKSIGTDKVSANNLGDHQYQYIYSKYLGHLRNEPIRLLEIGGLNETTWPTVGKVVQCSLPTTTTYTGPPGCAALMLSLSTSGAYDPPHIYITSVMPSDSIRVCSPAV